MAVTIHTTPQAYTLSDNDVLWSFSSDQTAQPNFEYRVEIRVNGILQYTGKVFPIQGAVAYFNASEILRGLVLATTINSQPVVSINNIDTLFFANQSLRTVQITVIERYGNPITNQASANQTVRVWKGAESENRWLVFNHNEYVIGTEQRQFLTNFPRNQKYWIDPTKNVYLSMINTNATEEIAVQWSSDDDGDNYSFGTFAVGVYFFNFNLQKINQAFGTAFEQFATFQLYDTSVSPISVYRSELFRFDLTESCLTDRTVYFLNKLGAVDQWMFTTRKQVNRDFKRSEFKKKFGGLSGNNYTYDSFSGRAQNFHNSSREVITLDSDWLHPDVHAWLVQELLESPLVWMEDANGIKTRYLIQNAASDEGQERYDVWKQLSLEMKPTLQSYSATL